MKIVRQAPDLVFVIDKKQFLKASGKIEMEPGYTSVFLDEINRAVIKYMQGKVIDTVRPTVGQKVEYKNVTVQKVSSGPGFAVISYRDGVVIDLEAEPDRPVSEEKVPGKAEEEKAVEVEEREKPVEPVAEEKGVDSPVDGGDSSSVDPASLPRPDSPLI